MYVCMYADMRVSKIKITVCMYVYVTLLIQPYIHTYCTYIHRHT